MDVASRKYGRYVHTQISGPYFCAIGWLMVPGEDSEGEEQANHPGAGYEPYG